MSGIDLLSESRRAVIKNIEEAVKQKNSFAKVEISDPKVDGEREKRIIAAFDNVRKSPIARMKAAAARMLAESLTEANNADTSIKGIENAVAVSGGAVITSNHYAPTDSTPIRMLCYLCGRRKNLHIIVEDSNIFMKGLFGFLMRNCNTHPVSKSSEYMVKSLKPALKDILEENNFLLVYPEAQMWRNYKKPRMLEDGAYHYAALFGKPVIPTFTTMVTKSGKRDSDGFLPVKHTLYVGAPIYPDASLSVRENRAIMQRKDYEFKKFIYESEYGIPLDDTFIPERDIAGI